MITQGSLDIVSRQRLLSTALYETCIKLGVPESQHDELVEKGRDLFTITSNGFIKPLAHWPDIKSFVNNRGNKVFQPQNTTTSAASQRAKRKAELYDLLCHYAEAGDVAGYRQTRELYASL